MSWLDASEYLAIEQAVKDRVDEIERFSTERAFRSETPIEERPARPDRPAAGLPQLLATPGCVAERRAGAV